MSAAFWTTLRVRSLRNLWVGGHRARVIADSIGDGCTRNMVIGKANRLGLKTKTKRQIANAVSESLAVLMQTAEGRDLCKRRASLWRTKKYRRNVRVGRGLSA